jgi:Autographiviridae endonuclease VII
MADDMPLIPLATLNNNRIVVWGPNNEQLTLDDPRCEEIGIKTCSKCNQTKLITEFSLKYDSRNRSSLALQRECNKCRNLRQKRYAEANYDLVRSRARAARRRRNPDDLRNEQLKAAFNITLAEYNELLNSQGGGCAICGRQECKTGRNLAVDHDHSCCPETGRGKRKSCGKCIRGLLCADCNLALGGFADDPDLLMDAAVYVLSYRDVLRPMLTGLTAPTF